MNKIKCKGMKKIKYKRMNKIKCQGIKKKYI